MSCNNNKVELLVDGLKNIFSKEHTLRLVYNGNSSDCLSVTFSPAFGTRVYYDPRLSTITSITNQDHHITDRTLSETLSESYYYVDVKGESVSFSHTAVLNLTIYHNHPVPAPWSINFTLNCKANNFRILVRMLFLNIICYEKFSNCFCRSKRPVRLTS